VVRLEPVTRLFLFGGFMYVYKVSNEKVLYYFTSKKKALWFLEIGLGTMQSPVDVTRIHVDGVDSKEVLLETYVRETMYSDWQKITHTK
jgi:hypothetical protein